MGVNFCRSDKWKVGNLFSSFGRSSMYVEDSGCVHVILNGLSYQGMNLVTQLEFVCMYSWHQCLVDSDT